MLLDENGNGLWINYYYNLGWDVMGCYGRFRDCPRPFQVGKRTREQKILVKQRLHTREPVGDGLYAVGDGTPPPDALTVCLRAMFSDGTFPSPSATHHVPSATALICLC
ncbi:hypothetical protein HanIR_Chr12g0583911 [Helianthus annuus]|nr:hypothetical protein HanIR_Chr12g0583911 [Helianthus annuus]